MLGFPLVALLVAASDYWAYDVLSSHGVVAGVSILIVSYAAFSVGLWLLCIAFDLRRRNAARRGAGIR